MFVEQFGELEEVTNPWDGFDVDEEEELDVECEGDSPSNSPPSTTTAQAITALPCGVGGGIGVGIGVSNMGVISATAIINNSNIANWDNSRNNTDGIDVPSNSTVQSDLASITPPFSSPTISSFSQIALFRKAQQHVQGMKSALLPSTSL